MKHMFVWLTTIAFGLAVNIPAMANVVSDFDDGSLQGWTLSGVGFSFVNPGTGGNPSGFAQTIDEVPGGSGGWAVAPAQFHGDLRGVQSIQWDALLPVNHLGPVRLLIRNSSSTYIYTPPGGFLTGVWQTWVVPFNESEAGWALASGSDTLEQVRSNVVDMLFSVEVATTTGTEASLDNVTLNELSTPQAIPTLSLWGMGILVGLLTVIGFRRRVTWH